MGMRFINTNKKLRQLRNILAPLTWFTESSNFDDYKFQANPTKNNSIIGHWAEDGSPYEIICPPQLRDSIITGLNLLIKIHVR